MTRRRIESPQELQDRDRRAAQLPLYHQLYLEECAERQRVTASVRPMLTAAVAWGVAIGYAVTPAANAWAAVAIAACALILNMHAANLARVRRPR